MSKKPDKHSWIVTARVVVLREYITEDCTEADARRDFDEISIEENDIETLEVTFQTIESNE